MCPPNTWRATTTANPAVPTTRDCRDRHNTRVKYKDQGSRTDTFVCGHPSRQIVHPPNPKPRPPRRDTHRRMANERRNTNVPVAAAVTLARAARTEAGLSGSTKESHVVG